MMTYMILNDRPDIAAGTESGKAKGIGILLQAATKKKIHYIEF